MFENEWQIRALFPHKIEIELLRKDPLSKRRGVALSPLLTDIFEMCQYETVLELLEERCDHLLSVGKLIFSHIVVGIEHEPTDAASGIALKASPDAPGY